MSSPLHLFEPAVSSGMAALMMIWRVSGGSEPALAVSLYAPSGTSLKQRDHRLSSISIGETRTLESPVALGFSGVRVTSGILPEAGSGPPTVKVAGSFPEMVRG